MCDSRRGTNRQCPGPSLPQPRALLFTVRLLPRAVPAGVEVKVDLSTGTKHARQLHFEADNLLHDHVEHAVVTSTGNATLGMDSG